MFSCKNKHDESTILTKDFENLIHKEFNIGTNLYIESNYIDFDFGYYKENLFIQLTEVYYEEFLKCIMILNYEDYYDFEKYFSSLIYKINCMISIDCRNLCLPILQDKIQNFWRFSKLNNIISEIIFQKYQDKLLFYLKKQKTHIFHEIVKDKILNKQDIFNKNILKKYLDFTNMEIIFTKDLISNEIFHKDNLYENISLLNYRIDIMKKKNNIICLLSDERSSGIPCRPNTLKIMEQNLYYQLNVTCKEHQQLDDYIYNAIFIKDE